MTALSAAACKVGVRFEIDGLDAMLALPLPLPLPLPLRARVAAVDY
jgi:hypothetical protein